MTPCYRMQYRERDTPSENGLYAHATNEAGHNPEPEITMSASITPELYTMPKRAYKVSLQQTLGLPITMYSHESVF